VAVQKFRDSRHSRILQKDSGECSSV
jgi:hypothetical protein